MFDGRIVVGLAGDATGLLKSLDAGSTALRDFAATARGAGSEAAAAVSAPTSARDAARGPSPSSAGGGSSAVSTAAQVATAGTLATLAVQAGAIGAALRAGIKAAIPAIEKAAHSLSEMARQARRENNRIFDEKLAAKADAVTNRYAKGFLKAIQHARKVEDELEHWGHAIEKANGLLGRFSKHKLPAIPTGSATASKFALPKDAMPGASPANAAIGGGLGGLAIAGLVGVGAAGATAAAGVYKAVKAGSELSEQLDRAGVVFGDQVGPVTSAADDMARRFGTVKSEFLEGASGIGAMAQAAGLADAETAKLSTGMARLAADLSSQDNLSFADALAKIRSGLAGEAEPLRQNGVLLSEQAVKAKAAAMGLVKLGQDASESAKVQARAAIIADTLARANDDLAIHATGVSNGMRALSGRVENLFADAGMAIQPVAEAILTLGNAALRSLAEWVDANKQAVLDWATAATASGGVVFRAFKLVGQGAGLVADAIHFVPAGFLAFQATGLSALAAVARGFVGLGQGVEAVLGLLGYETRGVTDFLTAFADGLDDAAIGKWAELQAELAKPLPSAGIEAWFDRIGDAASEAIAKARDLARAPREADAAANQAARERDQQADAAYAKHLGERAKQVLESTRSPMAKLADRFNEINNLQANGLLDKAQADLAKRQAAREGLGEVKSPAALEAGSREARTAILESRRQMADPMRQVPDLLREQVRVSTEQVTLMRKIEGRVADSTLVGMEFDLGN